MWGGPRGDFQLDGGPALVDGWGAEGPRVLWRRPLGEGYAGIVADEERLYTQCLDEREEIVVALDRDTGETRWSHAAPVRPYENLDPQFGPGPNSTPALVGGRLVVVGSGGNLRALDARTGELAWELDLHARFGRGPRKEEYGYSSNVLVHAGKLLVAVGGETHGVVALEPADGSFVWGSAPFVVSYAPLLLADVAGHAELLLFTPEDARALDPDSGALRWTFPVQCFTGNNLTQALVLDERHLWIAAQLDGATRVLRLDEREGKVVPEALWRDARMPQAHWHSFEEDGVVYGSLGGNYSSELAAIDWRTGEVLWRHEGFHAVKGVWADGKLVFLDETGTLGLARLEPAGATILATHALLAKEAWTPPSLLGTTLYARDRREVVALDLARR